jgi:hypothetical protein
MTATVLVSGKLFRDPERKVSGAGKRYASATIKDVSGDDVIWWKLLAFDESPIDELLSLRDGDGIAASGSFRTEVYDRGAGPKVGFTLFADRLISAKRQKREGDKERRETGKPGPIDGVQAQRPIDDDLNDPLPNGWAS